MSRVDAPGECYVSPSAIEPVDTNRYSSDITFREWLLALGKFDALPVHYRHSMGLPPNQRAELSRLRSAFFQALEVEKKKPNESDENNKVNWRDHLLPPEMQAAVHRILSLMGIAVDQIDDLLKRRNGEVE